MKKNILALSLTLYLPLSTTSFAQEQQVKNVVVATIDVAASVTQETSDAQHEDISQDSDDALSQQETSEQYLARMRPEIQRLYPDYVSDDPENTMLYQYLEHYQQRQQYIPAFQKAQQSLQTYLTKNQPPKLRPLDPDESKLDALLYADLSKIYNDLAEIEQHVQPYLKFNAMVLQQVDFNAPLPAFSDRDYTRYKNVIESMDATYKTQNDALARLVNQIDAYHQKLNQFQNIASQKVYKAHLENINQLNIYSLVLGRFLNAQVKANDAIYLASRGFNRYQAEENPLWEQKFNQYLNSEQNQQRIQPLLANFPDQKRLNGTNDVQQELKLLNKEADRCRTQWFDENDEQFMLNGKLDQAKIHAFCQKNQNTLQQLLADQVQVKELPYESADIPNMSFLGNFRVYGDDLYYTDTEKNAVYRFDTKTLKEQLIYQHPLNIERDGCDHNMCRGVGATDMVLSKNGKIAYVASLDYNQVFAIDLSNHQVIQKYDVERYPRKLLLDESGNNLFVYNGVANSISKIQLASGHIQTQALPESHQGHFCRELDLSFSPISGDIKILGDWPNDPYIYMNSQDMSFYQSEIEVPYNESYLYDDYQYIVKIPTRSGDMFGVYDLRLNRLTQEIGLKIEDEEKQSYYGAWDRPDYLKAMGDLAGIGSYFVEKVAESSMDDPHQENRKVTQYGYIFHAQQGSDASVGQKMTFKLAFPPYKIVALANQRIMVLGADRGYDADVPNGKLVIYDLASAKSKVILAANREKQQAQTELNFNSLIEEPSD